MMSCWNTLSLLEEPVVYNKRSKWEWKEVLVVKLVESAMLIMQNVGCVAEFLALLVSVWKLETSAAHWYWQLVRCASKVCVAWPAFCNYQQCFVCNKSWAEDNKIWRTDKTNRHREHDEQCRETLERRRWGEDNMWFLTVTGGTFEGTAGVKGE